LLVNLDVDATLFHDLGRPDAVDGKVVAEVRRDLDLLAVGESLLASADPGRVLGEIVAAAAAEYGVVVVDGSAKHDNLRELAADAADTVVIPVRPDAGSIRTAKAGIGRCGTRVLGTVLVGVPTRPRGILLSSRRSLLEFLGEIPVFVSTIRSDTSVAWSARDRGLLLHELAAKVDRGVLAPDAVDRVLGLARDYVDLAEELVLRLDALT
jgi:cellulose biosynthesis protein BcsQ